MPYPRHLLIAALSFALGGCVPQTANQRPSAVESEPADALRGSLLLPPGTALPAGSRLRLSVLDRFNDGAELTSREMSIDSAPPISFRLPFDRGRVTDVTVYRLDAAIYGPEGTLLFTSDGEHPVNLGEEAEPTRIELMAIDRQSRSQRRYNCDGLPLNAEFADPDLTIEISNQQHRLRRAHAASGIRYMGANAEFWAKDGEARLQLGDRAMSCAQLAD